MKNTLEQLINDAGASTNYYVKHLSDIDKNNNVISTQDIVNEQNIPLVKKGTRITENVAQHILKHKLLKPIEQQVQLEKGLERELLLEQIEFILDKYPDLRQVIDATGNKKLITQLIKSYILSPLLVQKLTVFSQQLPAEFEKTLFCTLLAITITFEMKLPKEQIISAYIAGLSHDLGLLHISPDIFTDKKLSAEEWRAIQSHSITSYIFVKNIGRDYTEIATAILEHHERSDGSGYPMGKRSQQLGIIGQIIGIADSLQATRINQFDKIGRNLRDALPYLQMNPDLYSEDIYRATVSVIKKIPDVTTPVNPFKDIDELVKHLIARGEKLSNASLIIRVLLHLSTELNLLQDGKAMIHVITPFDKMIRQSGLVEEHILKWLEYINSSDGYCPLKELCELELMQNELYWQLKKARNSIINFLEQEPDAGTKEIMQHLNKISAEIDSFL